eukprot:5362617-Prymnesium_polylepis.1
MLDAPCAQLSRGGVAKYTGAASEYSRCTSACTSSAESGSRTRPASMAAGTSGAPIAPASDVASRGDGGTTKCESTCAHSRGVCAVWEGLVRGGYFGPTSTHVAPRNQGTRHTRVCCRTRKVEREDTADVHTVRSHGNTSMAM